MPRSIVSNGLDVIKQPIVRGNYFKKTKLTTDVRGLIIIALKYKWKIKGVSTIKSYQYAWANYLKRKEKTYIFVVKSQWKECQYKTSPQGYF